MLYCICLKQFKIKTMDDKYFILKAMLIGFSVFFIRYAFYLSSGKLAIKKYLIFLALIVVLLSVYFIYLKYYTP